MTSQEQIVYLQEITKDYAFCIVEAIAVIGDIYAKLAACEEDPGQWMIALETLHTASEQSRQMAYFNCVIDQRRSELATFGNASPVPAYELGCILAQSMSICGLAKSLPAALDLPIIDTDRLESLYTPELQYWLASMGALQAPQQQLPA